MASLARLRACFVGTYVAEVGTSPRHSALRCNEEGRSVASSPLRASVWMRSAGTLCWRPLGKHYGAARSGCQEENAVDSGQSGDLEDTRGQNVNTKGRVGNLCWHSVWGYQVGKPARRR